MKSATGFSQKNIPNIRPMTHMGIIKGSLLTLGIAILLILLASLILMLAPIPDTYTSIICSAINILSIVVGTWSASKNFSSNSWLWGGLTGVLYMLFLWLAGVCIYGVHFTPSTALLIGLGFVFGAFGAIIGKNMRVGKRRR